MRFYLRSARAQAAAAHVCIPTAKARLFARTALPEARLLYVSAFFLCTCPDRLQFVRRSWDERGE